MVNTTHPYMKGLLIPILAEYTVWQMVFTVCGRTGFIKYLDEGGDYRAKPEASARGIARA